MTRALRIAWDVDDVLNDLMRDWFLRAHLPSHPTCALRYEDLRANPPHEILGLSRDAFLASLDAFRAANQATLAPSPEVLAWFERHGDDHRHFAITATPSDNAARSTAWVVAHFGRWIRTLSFVPSPRPNDRGKRWDATKLDLLAALGGVDAIVDDTLKNLENAEKYGVRAITFPRPWNGASASVEETLASIAIEPRAE